MTKKLKDVTGSTKRSVGKPLVVLSDEDIARIETLTFSEYKLLRNLASNILGIELRPKIKVKKN